MEDEGSPAVGEEAPPSSTDPSVIITEKQNNLDSECDTIGTATDDRSMIEGDMNDLVHDESGVIVNGVEISPVTCDRETGEGQEDARSLGELDSLPAGDELALGAAGSDSGVEGCGRALSSGGGSRSCASSVVSCGSGCGSESSSLAGAPPRPRRRLNVNLAEPKRPPPAASTPRPATAPRGPNLATRERARSREKPTPPEKPRPLTPKPRIRPTADLPNLVRESPALRAKPTKTSAARCRTPNSPGDEKRWPTTGPRLTPVADASAARLAADKYGTLPRRRRDAEDGSPKHDATPPSSRRPTVARSASSRGASTRARVRIFAEKTSQTVLVGTDVEAALKGIVPDVHTRVCVSVSSRGVQAGGRGAESARAAALGAALAQERTHRHHLEAALADERAARLAALADLDRNQQRLIELAGAAGTGAGAEGCLRALEEQLKAAGELAAKNRAEIDSLRDHCNRLNTEVCAERERARAAEARLAESEREAAEMHDFLAAETAALQHSLHDADADVARLSAELDKSRAECRQLVRMCEQRRQEALCAAARARGGAGAARALEALTRRVHALSIAVSRAYRLPPEPDPTVYYNDAYSRSDSGEALTPEEERGGLAGAVARALRHHQHDEDASRLSDDGDNSAELLDSETEPCLVTDPEYAEEWWSGAEGAGAWSGDELSPERDSCPEIDKEGESGSASERESLRTLSAAIAGRQRAEAGGGAARGALAARLAALDQRLAALLRALARAQHTPDPDGHALAHLLRERLEVTEKNVADVVVKKLAELDASKNMMEQYRQSVENLKKQLAINDEQELARLEEELREYSECERRAWYVQVESALSALTAPAAHSAHSAHSAPALSALAARLERLALALLPALPAQCDAPAHTA